METSHHVLPRWFVPVAVVALLWNAMGCAAYLMDVMLTPADVAKLPSGQQAMYAARPAWAVAGTAVAVWGGLLGCLGLILKKRWALPLLAASLVGVIVQDLGFLTSPVVRANFPSSAIILQTLVLLVAIGLLLLARRGVARGWLR